MEQEKLDFYRAQYGQDIFNLDLHYLLTDARQKLGNDTEQQDSVQLVTRVMQVSDSALHLKPMIIDEAGMNVLQQSKINFFALGQIFARKFGETMIPLGAFFGVLCVEDDGLFPSEFAVIGDSVNGHKDAVAFNTDATASGRIIPLLDVKGKVKAEEISVGDFLDGYYSEMKIDIDRG